MVLPDRIELSTSPLPMECSTTELRQHAPDTRNGLEGLHKAGRSLPHGPLSRKRGTDTSSAKMGRSAAAPCRFQPDRCRPIRFPIPRPEAARVFIPAGMSSVYSVSDTFLKREANGSTMQNEDGKRERRPGKDVGQHPRQDRLKLALRENLKRRKSQARGRSETGAAPSDPGDATPYGSGNKPGE